MPLRLWLVLTIVLGALGAGTALAYQWVHSRQMLALHQMVDQDCQQTAERLQGRIDGALSEMRQHLARAADPSALPPARRFLRDHPAWLRLGSVDDDGACRWILLGRGTGRLRDVLLPGDPYWGRALADARQTRSDALAGRRSGPDGIVLDIVSGAFPAGGQSGARRTIIGTLALDPILADIINKHDRREFIIELRDSDGLILRIGAPHDGDPQIADRRSIRVANRQWQLDYAASRSAASAQAARQAKAVLVGGGAFALLITALLWQVMLYRWRGALGTRQHLEALESLAEVSSAIGAKLGAGQEVLDQLADAACRLLNVSKGGIALLDEKSQSLHVSGLGGRAAGRWMDPIPMEEATSSRHCLESGEILLIPDVAKYTGPINSAMRDRYGCAALVMAPLKLEGRSIGVLYLADARPRAFSQSDRRLIELIALQAAVILSNRRLLEQTRRDAEVRAILLQELQHRVRNNLSGIVGLLSTAPGDMPESSRQWVHRVADRIRTIAAADEMFTREVDHVGLRQLVDRVVSALSVIRPAELEIRLELDGVQLELAAPQAVGLAMALHELCVNAIVHGLSGAGPLVIRTRRVDRRIAIDVIDNGASRRGALAHASGASGLGLQLVRELVGRELSGNFRMEKRSDGGTTATIEMPWGSTSLKE